MAEVDADDDGLDRWILRHYAYDEVRRQRRHIFVTAYDSETEGLAALDRADADLRARRSRDDVDEREHFTLLHLTPGSAARTRELRQGGGQLHAERKDLGPGDK